MLMTMTPILKKRKTQSVFSVNHERILTGFRQPVYRFGAGATRPLS
jgi:hypothetical protein